MLFLSTKQGPTRGTPEASAGFPKAYGDGEMMLRWRLVWARTAAGMHVYWICIWQEAADGYGRAAREDTADSRLQIAGFVLQVADWCELAVG